MTSAGDYLIRDRTGAVQVVPRSLIVDPEPVNDVMDWYMDDKSADLPGSCHVSGAGLTVPSNRAGGSRDNDARSCGGSQSIQGQESPCSGAASIVHPDRQFQSALGSLWGPIVSLGSFIKPLEDSDEETQPAPSMPSLATIGNPSGGKSMPPESPGDDEVLEWFGSFAGPSPTLAEGDAGVVADEVKEWEEVFPTYSWDEETFVPGHKESLSSHCDIVLHTSTRILGHEGLLPDTGAVKDLSGSEFVERQATEAAMHGYQTVYQELPNPQGVSGVGGQDKVCKRKAELPGCLLDGTVIKYCPTIIPESSVPPLVGLDTMGANNVYFGTKLGTFTMIPEGTDDKIIWPPGTKHLQCVKAPSGHWLLTVSAWIEANRSRHSQAPSARPT